MFKLRGFTLIEAMVVVAIVAVLVGIAAPSFKNQIQSSAMTSSVNSFLSDMRYARSEAIRRGGTVIMCRSDSPEASSPTCGTGSGPNGNGWVSGWIIFQDLNGSGNKTAAEPLLRAQGPITSINSIGNSSTKIIFAATGRLQSLSGGAMSLQFGSSPDFSNAAQRMVCISISGRGRIAGDGLTSCP
jgi:type IV fimbrial biogenesis protein FimT